MTLNVVFDKFKLAICLLYYIVIYKKQQIPQLAKMLFFPNILEK